MATYQVSTPAVPKTAKILQFPSAQTFPPIKLDSSEVALMADFANVLEEGFAQKFGAGYGPNGFVDGVIEYFDLQRAGDATYLLTIR